MRGSVGCECSPLPIFRKIQFSLHTNYCDLGFCLAEDGRRLVLISCIDNLQKGAAGQAVQNMNLMYGWKRGRGSSVKIVVKIGGAALEDKSTLYKCAHAVVDLARDGHKVAVVHGGGSALTRTLKLLGKQSEFVDGLRITDAETRDIALMVLAGIVNKSFVAAIVAAGNPAIGLCGGDGMSFPLVQEKNRPRDTISGASGKFARFEPRWFGGDLERTRYSRAVVLSFWDRDGEYYNVNADQMAAACAEGLPRR